MHRFVLLSFVTLACLQPSPLRRPPGGFGVLDVVTPGGDLRAVGRLASLTLRFERPLTAPPADAIMVVTGAPGDALRSDATDGVLSTANAARRIPLRVELDPRDASTLHVAALAPLLPDTTLTLLVTPKLVAHDGASFVDDHDEARAWMQPLRVAPARRCGALARVEAPSEVAASTARVYLRFDRPTRGDGLALLDERDRPVPARATVDCLDDEGWGRCAWIEPSIALPADATLRVVAHGLVSRNGLAPEAVLGTLRGALRTTPHVTLAPAPVCAVDERAMGETCVRVDDRVLSLRVATTQPALVRVTAVPEAATLPKRVGVGAWETLHAVRVRALAANTVYGLEVEVLGADGAVHATTRVAGVTTPAPHARVRIGEVLARPRSTSAQEFVELVNDGDAAVDLDDFSLAQDASRATLPRGTRLAPGQRAILVGSAYDPRGDARVGDAPVAPGTPVVVMRASVAGRGLRDSGADLTLRGPDGVTLSRMPGADPGREPRAGVSLVRADTELDEDDPAAWAWDAQDGSTPGAPDRLR